MGLGSQYTLCELAPKPGFEMETPLRSDPLLEGRNWDRDTRVSCHSAPGIHCFLTNQQGCNIYSDTVLHDGLLWRG
jgi:hypothetical protein